MRQTSGNSHTRNPRTVERARVTVDDDGFVLAPGEDVDDLKRRIIGAVAAGGRFVDVAALDGRGISVLVSATSHITIAVDTVVLDTGDTGDTGDDGRSGEAGGTGRPVAQHGHGRAPRDATGFDGAYDGF